MIMAEEIRTMKFRYLIVLVILFMMCGCAKNEAPRQENDEQLPSGELIIVDGESAITLPVYNFDTFNPVITASEVIADGMRAVYEPLFDFDASGRKKGVLAESISMSPDGLTATVNLKNGVLWHDGSTFSAEDVVYTVNTIKANKSVYSHNVRDVVSCRSAGNAVVFTLSRPVPEFAALLNFPIIKNGTSREQSTDYIPIGTGPYKYREKSGSNRIIFTASSNWHGGAAKIKNITFEILKDKDSAVYAFEANELQCITTKTIDLTKHTPKGAVRSADFVSNNMVFLGMNFYNSVLWGESTRQAIAYMIDKEKIVKSDMYDRAVETDIPVNPSLWYYDAETGYNFDTVYAEEILASDGWIKNEYGKYIRDFNGTNQLLSLELLVNSDNDEKISIANRIAAQMNDLGMSIKIVPLPYAEYTQRINSKQFDLFIGEIEMPGNMDPTILTGSGGNYFTYVSGEMDNLVKTMGLTYDEEAYKVLHRQFAELFCKDMPFVPICFKKGSLIYSSAISGDIKPNMYGIYSDIGEWYTQLVK